MERVTINNMSLYCRRARQVDLPFPCHKVYLYVTLIYRIMTLKEITWEWNESPKSNPLPMDGCKSIDEGGSSWIIIQLPI